MPISITRPFIEVRASRGIAKDYNQASTAQGGIRPPNDFKAMEQMWKQDEVIATAIDTTVDMVTRNGWDFVSKTEDKTLSKTERNKAVKQFDDLNFDEVIDNILYQMITYGDAFMELRRTMGTTIDEIHPLETTEMRIEYDEHGSIGSYIQVPTNFATTSFNKGSRNVPGQVKFAADNVIHFRMKWMGSKVYSETPLEPVARIWATKQNSFNYLDQMFVNLHPELFIHLKGAGEDQYNETREALWRAKTQPGKAIVTYGSSESSTEINQVISKFGNEQGLKWVLEYLRESILMITRVPPVWIGMVNRDGANKGNSEAQIFSFETRVRKIQKKIEHLINNNLLPVLGYQHLEFNFNPITFKSETNAVQNASIFASINVKPEAIVRYLKRNGITDIRKEDFITPEEMMETSMMGAQGNQSARNMTSPSREPSDKSSVTNKLDQTGSSDAGSKKLDEQAMKTRSTKETSFSGYPYEYEVRR